MASTHNTKGAAHLAAHIAHQRSSMHQPLNVICAHNVWRGEMMMSNRHTGYGFERKLTS
jgi:hypothetical protein